MKMELGYSPGTNSLTHENRLVQGRVAELAFIHDFFVGNQVSLSCCKSIVLELIQASPMVDELYPSLFLASVAFFL